MTYSQWITDFLAAIGAQPTPQNIAFMNAWIAKESGSYPIGYGWNPLNTTHTMPGSYGGGAQGNIQFFPDYQSGLTANVNTITSGLYPDLLAALRGGSPSLSANYAGLNTWGTGSLAGYGSSSPNPTASPGGLAWQIAPGMPWPGTMKLPGAPSSSSSSPATFLDNIRNIPILGQGAADVVSVGIVGSFAIVFFLIGGAWLIFGSKSGQTVVKAGTTVSKTAGKVAALAA